MAITAKFRNNGEVCISPARFYIHEKKKDEFAKTLVEKVSKLKIGNGMDDDTILGPLTTGFPSAIICLTLFFLINN